VGNNLRQSSAKVRGLEDVFENSSDVRPRSLVCIDSEGTIAKIQGANIVKAKNVISMAVGYQDRIKAFQPIAQSLLTKVR
jgi:hypothetical protein